MKKEMRVAVIHMEARRYYSLPRLFHECGVLSAFHTDIFVKSRWAKLLMAWAERAGIKGVTDLKGRYHEGLKDASIKDYKIFGIAYKLIWHRLQPQKRLPFMLKAFKIFNKLVLLRGVKKANVIYAFPGEAMGIFQSLELQTVKILDQNSVGYRYFCEVLAEERERWPGWDSLPHHFDDNISLIEREEKEWLLADGIIVPSDFVLEKLKLHGISDKKIDVVPYPADLSMYSPKKRRRGDGPLKVLFLGYVGLIKGIPYLLEAAERLGPSNICVRAVGEIQVARDKLAYYKSVAHFPGRVPRSQVNNQLAWADVLCMPSLCEGQSLATNEALASGLPVICTPNTGSRVRNGIDGTIVPVRNVDALVDAFKKYIDNPGLLSRQSEQMIADRDRLGFPAYRDALFNAVKSRFKAQLQN